MAKPLLELVGRDGNIFSIIARGTTVLRNNGYDKEKIEEFIKEMKQGTYDDALQTCHKWFNVY